MSIKKAAATAGITITALSSLFAAPAFAGSSSDWNNWSHGNNWNRHNNNRIVCVRVKDNRHDWRNIRDWNDHDWNNWRRDNDDRDWNDRDWKNKNHKHHSRLVCFVVRSDRFGHNHWNWDHDDD